MPWGPAIVLPGLYPRGTPNVCPRTWDGTDGNKKAVKLPITEHWCMPGVVKFFA